MKIMMNLFMAKFVLMLLQNYAEPRRNAMSNPPLAMSNPPLTTFRTHQDGYFNNFHYICII